MENQANSRGSARHLGSPASAVGSAPVRTHLASPVCLHDALVTVLRHASSLTGCELVGLYVFEDEGDKPRLRLFAHVGLEQSDEQEFAVLALAQDLATQAAATNEVVTCPEAADAGLQEACCQALRGTCRSATAVPLTLDDWTIGTLLLMSRHPGCLTPEVTPLLRPLADHLALLIAFYTFSQQVQADRDTYARVASNVSDCIWSLYPGATPRLALVTDGIFELTGYTREEVLRDPQVFTSLIDPEDRPAVNAAIAKALAGETTEVHYRCRMTHRSGETRWTHTRGRAIQDENGCRIDGITIDMTEHVRLEEKVRRADRLSAVSILAGGIAHEYNNLHFAILGTLDLLLMRDDLEEGVRTHVNRVREAAERASDITNKLVAFARSGGGGREVLEVSELLDATLGMVQKEFITQGIDVQIEQAPVSLRVCGNRAELGQVLINLVINAQQAMQDRPVKRLLITTGLRDGRSFISITDTGHGISAENLPRLFDPFFTTKGAAGSWSQDRAATDAYLPGRGLGLSVAQTIVEEHGGDIEVESEVGCGARFTVYLPVPDLSDSQALQSTTPAGHRKGRIIIADDETAVREVCRDLLEQLSYEVAEAGGGVEALELLAAEDYDLILVDLQMPDMEGLELVRRINELPEERRPAKLIITGNIDEMPAETCSELGICGLLQKRSSLSELVAKVQLALDSRG